MENGEMNEGYQENTYEAPVQEPQNTLEEPVSLGEWMITYLIMCIPCVNIVMMFVWAFSKKEKKSKSNYFKASLIWACIMTAISIIFAIILVAAGVGAALG